MLSQAEARNLTDEIKRDAVSMRAKIQRAYEGEAHLALGYRDWPEYCETEFHDATLSIPRSERPALVAYLRSTGMSQRAIANVTNVGKSQINRDLAPVPNGTPDDGEPPVLTGRVIGRDGKSYAPGPPPDIPDHDIEQETADWKAKHGPSSLIREYSAEDSIRDYLETCGRIFREMAAASSDREVTRRQLHEKVDWSFGQ
jgi:hypothetical protein